MSGPLVQRFRNDTAPRLLAKFGNGGVATTVRVITPDPNPLRPPTETLTPTEIDAHVKGVSASAMARDPNLVSTDLVVLVAAISYSPAVGDIMQLNSADRIVIRWDAIPAAGDPAIYKVYVR